MRRTHTHTHETVLIAVLATLLTTRFYEATTLEVALTFDRRRAVIYETILFFFSLLS